MMQRFPRFGAPPFRDSIEEDALRYDPKAPYGEPALGDSDGQRLFDPPDVEPSMNKDSLVATPSTFSTFQMAADMTPNVYRPENGEPYTNTGAPWHQGQLPAFPYGDLLVSSSPLHERINGPIIPDPIPGEAGYNDASEMASSAPMSHPRGINTPPAPMEHPIVRDQRERAELAPDPSLDYDSEVPIREARQSFQPPPEMATGMVGVTQPQMREPAAVTAPPPTAAPPESTIAKLIRQRLENKEPERGPVSKWAKLAAVALGAGQGYYNAANPNARPIDASEAVQNLTFGRKYLDAMGKYQRTNKNLDEQIKLVGEAEDIESKKAALARQIRQDDLIDNDRDATRIANNFRIGVDFAKSGSVVVPRGSQVTPGAVRIDANPLDPTGKTVVDVMPTGKQRIITDQRIATALGRKLNDLVSDAEYIQGAKEVWEYDKAIKLKELEVAAKPDSTQTTDYKNYLLSQKDGFKGTFEQWQDKDANRKRPVNNITTSYAPSPDGTADPTIEAMAKYEIDVPRPRSSSPAAMAQYDQIIKAVKKLNPQYDATVFQTAQRTIDAFNSGNESRSVNAINTAAGHVGVLAQAARALDSGDITLLNKIANAYGTQTGNDKLSVYKTIVHRLAPEITRSYVGAGGGEGDRIANESDFDPSLGTKRILANLGTTANLYKSKINALGHQFEKGARGRKFEGYITPEAQRVFDSFAPNAGPGRSGGGAGTTHFVDGGTIYDVPADMVAAFKAKHPNAKAGQ